MGRPGSLRLAWMGSALRALQAVGLAPALALFLTLATPGSSAAQCQLDVRPVDDDRLKYQQRDGNRCEGLYVELQSAPLQLRVVSLIRGGGLRPELEDRPQLHISVPDPALLRAAQLEDSVRVLAQPRRAGIPWVLDGLATKFDPVVWNLDEVFRTIGISLTEVGVSGRARRTDGTDDPVFVPVEVAPPDGGSTGDSIQFVFQLPAAGAARVCITGDTWCSEVLRPLEGGDYFDGYFRAMLPPGPAGIVPLEVMWRESGQPSGGRDRLDIYRW